MSFTNPYVLLLAIPLCLIWWLYLRPQPRTGGLRLFLMLLLLMALADPRGSTEHPQHHLTILVDNSLSVRGEALRQGVELAQQLATSVPDQQRYVLTFGQHANVINRPGEPLDGISQHSAEDASDLSAGLRLASALSPATGSHAVLVISDGLYTGLDPRVEIPTLQKQQVRLHYWPLSQIQHADVAISRVLHPTRSAVGQPFQLAVEIEAPHAQTAQLQLRNAAEHILATTPVTLQAGLNRYNFTWQATHTGLHRYSVEVLVAEDTQPENNRAHTAIDIIGASQVLVINREGQQTALVRALTSSGLQVVVQNGRAPLSSAGLKHYVAVVLENMPLDRLNDDADVALNQYVQRLGGGLLITGGRSSYAMGGYYRSYLEDLLPVSMDRQEELRRPQLAMAIVLDRSGSMTAEVKGGATKMDLANRGAVEALQLLTPQDDIAVFAVDSEAHQVVALQPLGEGPARRKLVNRVLRIESQGGGIFVYEGLTAAIEALLSSEAPTKHIVLFSDAADSEQPGDYQPLLQQWRGVGGSLSVIGLGTEQDADAKLLQEMATLGGGREYFTDNALQLPRVFAQDVMHVARQSFIEATTSAQTARGLLALRLPLTEIPSVAGYNLSYLKPDAELMLLTQDEHEAPLVAGWQRGQGKVLTVMFEADGQFTGAWVDWPEYKQFFRQALEWLKRSQSGTGQWFADVQLHGHTATVRLDLATSAALTAAPQALVITPDEREILTVPLSWASPTQLTGSFELSSDGVYHGAIQLPAQPPLLLPPRILPYSPEFKPRRLDPTAGTAVLQQLAAATGGGRFTHVSQLTTATTVQQARGRSYAPVLLTLVLLLMLLDIGLRRGLWIGVQRQVWTHVSRWRLPRWSGGRRQRASPLPVADTEAEATTSSPPVTGDALAQAKRHARNRLAQ